MANKPPAHEIQFPRQAGWYVSAMGHLVHVVQSLSQVRSLDEIMAIVRSAARAMTGADGATFVLRDGDSCFYADEDAIEPLWKGQRFPVNICISGWVMLNGEAAVIEDIYADPRIPVDAYRPTFVKSLAMVPIREKSPLGAIGVYWARTRKPTEEEVRVLQALAHLTAVSIENVVIYKELQEKIAALEDSNSDLSRFAWSASHDMKSPLRALGNLARWVEEDSGDALSEGSRQHLKQMHKRVARLDKLLDDMLAYSQIEARLGNKQLEMADGRTLLDDVRALTDIPPGFDLVFSDSVLNLNLPRLSLQQILCNLVDNAIKHHDRGKGQIVVTAAEEIGRYIITVADDGPGIDPAYHEKIFEMFQTLSPRDIKEGSGMGLSIVRKILTVSGGTITVESDGRRGSRFRFTWPKAAAL